MSVDLPDNFADFPKSLDEVRAERDDKASIATPRGNLITLLREIDQGKIAPEALVIAWRCPPSEDYPSGSVSFMAASPNCATTAGLFEIGKLKALGAI